MRAGIGLAGLAIAAALLGGCGGGGGGHSTTSRLGGIAGLPG